MKAAGMRAAGKLFLIGEYAVLEGEPAGVTAVDRYAIMAKEAQEAEAGLIEAVAMEAARALGERFDEAARALAVDTSAFFGEEGKLGLGSSAATAALAAGVALSLAGVDIETETGKRQAWHIAKAGHDAFFSVQGSGADIAAAIYGGMIRFQRPDKNAPPIIEPWRMEGLHFGFVRTKTPASTAGFLQAVEKFKARSPQVYQETIENMGFAAEQFLKRKKADETMTMMFVGQYNQYMDVLGQYAQAPIVNMQMDRVIELAHEFGGAAKPSGAGGGDAIVAFFTEADALAGYLEAAAIEGYPSLQVGLSEKGLHFVNEDTR